MAQTTEFIEVGDGILTFVREGRKLVKASFADRITKQIQHNHTMTVIEDDIPVLLKRCQECTIWLEQNDKGHWVDFDNRFLCKDSPTSMHRVVN